MAADGSIIIDTRINTAGFGKGATNLKAQFGSLGSSIKKLGGMIATAFSVTALVNFGKQAIELGSDLQEVQNVVNVTFTTMNEQVNKFAKNAAKTAGLSETMAKRYVGTFGAMANAFQFTEGEAYDMATSLTQLAGDVASFYNITQDEAYTKLKSVFTGETESLKDLGVVMTQTALDDFALRKGLSKTTSEMTEQEKVALRYQFILEQLSAASGDFVRTSDGWANQTRILSLQFDQLKATLGQGLINALNPAIKVVNELIARFQVLADQFLDFTNTVFGNAGDTSSAISNIADNTSELADSIKEAGSAAKKYLAPFDEIIKITSESENDTSPAISGISGVISGGNVTVGAEVKDNISPVIDKISEKPKELLDPLQSIDFSKAQGELVELGESFSDLGAIITDALEWAWFNILTPLAEWAIEDAAPASVGLLASVIDVLSSSLDLTANCIEELYSGAKPVFEWLGETVVFAVEKITNSFKSWGNWLEREAPQITGICENIGTIISDIWTVAEPVLTSLRTAWGDAFDKITEHTQEKASEIVSELATITDFLSSDMMKDVYNNIVGYINAILEVVTDGINGVIDAANTLSFDVPDWVPGIGGETFGFDLERLTAPQIPYLAEGAVIPPRAPFYAVLGDQPHGTNIEAPEGLIRSIFKEEMADIIGGMIAGFEAVVENQKATQEIIRGIEIGDDTIGQAVARYNAKMAIIRGGNA